MILEGSGRVIQSIMNKRLSLGVEKVEREVGNVPTRSRRSGEEMLTGRLLVNASCALF